MPVSYTLQPPAVEQVRRDLKLANDRLALSMGTVENPGVEFRATRADGKFSGKAHELTLVADADSDTSTIYARIEVRDCVLDYAGERTPLLSKEWSVAAPMSPTIAALSHRTVAQYLEAKNQYSKDTIRSLLQDVVRQSNQVESELHARCSFALSCVLLALVGAMIGMMTRSGNFVTAFAVSVGPALVAIVLIVTGQHICESMPHVSEQGHVDDPLRIGLPILWAGNVIVLGLGMGLYYKLSRT